MIEARARTADPGPGRSVPLTITEDTAGGTALLLRGRGGPGSAQGIAARLSGTMRLPSPSSRLERRLAAGGQDLRKSGRSRLVLSPSASSRLRNPEMRLTPHWGTE
jgi:hypothetical protein